MKTLYEVIMADLEKEKGIRVFNLSYDISKNEPKATLKDETFIEFLNNEKMICTDAEFVVVEDLSKPIPDNAERYFIIRPAETTLIFCSKKSLHEISNVLNEYPELHFAIVELPVQRDRVKPMVINHIDDGANATLMEILKQKDDETSEQLKRFNHLAGADQRDKREIRILKTRK